MNARALPGTLLALTPGDLRSDGFADCIEAVERGVAGVVILNGKTPHAVLLELFTPHGAGTLIRA